MEWQATTFRGMSAGECAVDGVETEMELYRRGLCCLPLWNPGAFEQLTRTRSAIYLTLVTAVGLLRNSHSGIVKSEETLDDLFRP